MIVRDLNWDMQFISDSQDVQPIKDDFSLVDGINDFDSFFVKSADGDCTEVYGMVGIVPYLDKEVTKIL